MSNSSINIGSQKICGNNLGTGSTVYVCNDPFNTLNFKSIAVAGTGLSINSTGDTIIISGNTSTGSTGGDGVVSGATLSGTELQLSRTEFLPNVNVELSGLTTSSFGVLNSIQLSDGSNNFTGNSGLYFTGSGTNAIGIGDSTSSAIGNNSIAIGYNACTLQNVGIAIGRYSYAYNFNDIAIGGGAGGAGGFNLIQIGVGANCNGIVGNNSIAIGNSSEIGGDDAISIGGSFATTSNNKAISIGSRMSSCGVGSIIMGSSSATQRDNNINCSFALNFDKANHTFFISHTGSSYLAGDNPRLGLGTTDATARLEVVATGATDGFKLVDGNQQTGYVLTSDANGVGTWQQVSGSSGADGVVSGATLTGGSILTLARTESLSNVTIDLAPLASGGLTAENGLTIQGANVVLGGTLTGDTTINTANAYSTVIGNAHTIQGTNQSSVIIGGTTNSISGSSFNAAIIGGGANCIDTNGFCSAIVGGCRNCMICNVNGSMLGGYINTLCCSQAGVIIGGAGNGSYGSSNSLIGGSSNSDIYTTSSNSVILGGSGHEITFSNNSAIIGSVSVVFSGGTATNATSNGALASQNSCIVGLCAGGNNTLISAAQSCVCNDNQGGTGRAVILGSVDNMISDSVNTSTISSQLSNVNNACDTSIIAGRQNCITPDGVNDVCQSAIIGGRFNTLSGTTNTVILGGGVGIINSDYNDHAVVDNLAIISTPAAGGSNDLLTWETGGTGLGSVRKVTQASISDVRLKTILKPIDNALNGIVNLNGFIYKFNELMQPESMIGKKRYGLSAQDVEDFFPLVVNNNLQFDSGLYKTVEYRELVPVLVEAIKELNTKNKDLESRIIELEKK